MIAYLLKGYISTKKHIDSKKCSYNEVKGWISHLPHDKDLVPIDAQWEPEVYKFSTMFLEELYEYSIQMKYIEPTLPFEKFYRNEWDNPEYTNSWKKASGWNSG